VQEMLFDLTSAVGQKHRPDVAFVSFERWPRQRRIPRTEAWEGSTQPGCRSRESH
jgi:hypothetical protein